MAGTEKIMNHSEYMAKTKGMDDDALRFVIADCRAVLDAWRDAWAPHPHPNEGYYLDEINYCCDELARWAKKGKK